MNSVKRILVLGGGFAGLWSAVGAARKLDELGLGPDAVEVTLSTAMPSMASACAITRRT